MGPKLIIFCKQARLEVEGFGHQPNKSVNLWFVLPARCSGIEPTYQTLHQRDQSLWRDFIQKLMGADSKALGVLPRMERTDVRIQRGQGHHKHAAHRINRVGITETCRAWSSPWLSDLVLLWDS